MTAERKPWGRYFMDIANAVATRATCDRKHVGCVIVMGRRIVATGYNGSIPGLPHCDDKGHDMEDGHCVRTVHAEVNAVAQAARAGVSIAGSTAFVNTYPCWACFKVMAIAGITKIIYDDAYRPDERVRLAAEGARIEIYQILPSGTEQRQ